MRKTISSSVFMITIITVFFSAKHAQAVNPSWTVGTNNGQTTTTFTFSGFIASDGTINSTTQDIKLRDKKPGYNYIILSTPSGCTVGASSVPNANVRVIVNNAQLSNNASIYYTAFTAGLASNNGAVVSVRMLAVSTSAYGSVTCTTPGSLSYSY